MPQREPEQREGDEHGDDERLKFVLDTSAYLFLTAAQERRPDGTWHDSLRTMEFIDAFMGRRAGVTDLVLRELFTIAQRLRDKFPLFEEAMSQGLFLQPEPVSTKGLEAEVFFVRRAVQGAVNYVKSHGKDGLDALADFLRDGNDVPLASGRELPKYAHLGEAGTIVAAARLGVVPVIDDRIAALVAWYRPWRHVKYPEQLDPDASYEDSISLLVLLRLMGYSTRDFPRFFGALEGMRRSGAVLQGAMLTMPEHVFSNPAIGGFRRLAVAPPRGFRYKNGLLVRESDGLILASLDPPPDEPEVGMQKIAVPEIAVPSVVAAEQTVPEPPVAEVAAEPVAAELQPDLQPRAQEVVVSPAVPAPAPAPAPRPGPSPMSMRRLPNIDGLLATVAWRAADAVKGVHNVQDRSVLGSVVVSRVLNEMKVPRVDVVPVEVLAYTRQSFEERERVAHEADQPVHAGPPEQPGFAHWGERNPVDQGEWQGYAVVLTSNRLVDAALGQAGNEDLPLPNVAVLPFNRGWANDFRGRSFSETESVVAYRPVANQGWMNSRILQQHDVDHMVAKVTRQVRKDQAAMNGDTVRGRLRVVRKARVAPRVDQTAENARGKSVTIKPGTEEGGSGRTVTGRSGPPVPSSPARAPADRPAEPEASKRTAETARAPDADAGQPTGTRNAAPGSSAREVTSTTAQHARTANISRVARRAAPSTRHAAEGVTSVGGTGRVGSRRHARDPGAGQSAQLQDRRTHRRPGRGGGTAAPADSSSQARTPHLGAADSTGDSCVRRNDEAPPADRAPAPATPEHSQPGTPQVAERAGGATR